MAVITTKYKINLGTVSSLKSNFGENLPRSVQKTTDHPVTSQAGTTVAKEPQQKM